MRIDSAGRVLIGTTTQGESTADDLTIATSGSTGITIRAGTSNASNILFADGTSGDDAQKGIVQYHHSDDTMRLFTNATRRMTIDSSGRVGIGVTSFHDSSTRLQLQSPGSDHTGIVITAAAASTLAYLYMGDTDDKDIGRLVYDNSTNAMQMWTNNSERMRIDSSGVVCIGTTSPNGSASKLQVEDSGENNIYFVGNTSTLGARLILQNKNSTANSFSKVEGADASGQGVASIKFINVNDGNNEGAITLETRPSGGLPTERMRIDSSGSVLVGATSYGGGGSSPQLYVSTTSDRAVKIHNTNSATSSLQLTNAATGQGDDNGMQLAALSNGECGLFNAEAERILIQSQEGDDNKPVVNFIKPQGPSNAQTVMIAFETGNQGRGVIKSSSSDGGSPSFASTSDYRIKTNIRDYTDGYDNIKAIPVKLFDMISDGTKDIKGWIAHEVQSYIPEAVMGEKDAVDSDGKAILQNLSYGTFMPDVVSALQTAIAKIETLEAKVEALEAK